MADNNERIDQLLLKLESLLKRQEGFGREIYELRQEINLLKFLSVKDIPEENREKAVLPVSESSQPEKEIFKIYQAHRQKTKAQPIYSTPKAAVSPQIKSDLEKFIGENLINKIGILILIIGVAIGAKYSIEHELISPLTRIILGYLTGLGLIGFGIKLKKNYESYSAVLVSGAIAILYFITYAAYSFYGLFPQVFAFVLMVIFTVFTVVAAINYNRQVIAHIGLVGAYAVPFLLSEGSGNVAILFTYMAIINIGILFIAFKKYWKPLYYSSFILSWIIYFSWYATKYIEVKHFELSLIFLSVFFATFYLIFLAYKLIQKEKFTTGDVILLLSNSFIFYGIGYSILNMHTTGQELLGLFSLCNAIIHFGVCAVIYKQKLADRNLFFLIAGLVLVFITISIPVQLDGNWVTLLWAGEAALLFWIGKTKKVLLYERLSYPLMFLAFFSIVHDWNTYNNYYFGQAGTKLTPLLNTNFLASLLFIGAFAFIYYLNNNRKYSTTLFPQKPVSYLLSFAIPAFLLIAVYYSVQIEISTYWDQLYTDSAINIKKTSQDIPNSFSNYDLLIFKEIWILNYSLLFFSLLSFVNIKKIKSRDLGLVNLGLSVLCIVAFLGQGLNNLGELRESYLNFIPPQYYNKSSFHIGIRYISFALVALVLVSIHKYIKQDFLKPFSVNLYIAFDILLYTSLLFIASSELITWMDIMNFPQSYKLGLSILWGLYSLLLIAIGIRQKKKHLRLGAIGLFGITLIKLFFYDIAQLDTIAKTIVFVSLGILLLIISFLYNKYKHLIAGENET